MSSAGFGLNLVTSLTTTAIVLAGFTFIDDTDIIHAAATSHTDGTTLIPAMQRAVNLWEGLLRVTGGALCDDKSYWYLVDYKFLQGCWKYKSKLDLPGQIDLKVVDSRGDTRLEPSEARETLGVFVSMHGNWRRQLDVLIAKAQLFAEYLRTSKPDRNTTWYVFFTSFMKSLEYPMEAACLSKADWDEVMGPLLGITLQLCRMASTFPRDLLYTSLQFQDLGARHPFYQQMISHLAMLIAETSNDKSISGRLLQGVAEDLCREIGLPGEFTDAPWDRLAPVVTHTWLTHFLCFAAEHQVLIHVPLPKLINPRLNDSCLMEVFLRTPYTPTELPMLLSWRQYFNVIYVSDVVNASGDRLLDDIWNGTLLLRCQPDQSQPRRPPVKR
jgi:hypothetical protein